MSTSFDPALPDEILLRIVSEYNEMPGLRVTERQAQRLWGLDAPTCQQALVYLVDARFLVRTLSGQYTRAADGRGSVLPLRMAKATLDGRASGRTAC